MPPVFLGQIARLFSFWPTETNGTNSVTIIFLIAVTMTINDSQKCTNPTSTVIIVNDDIDKRYKEEIGAIQNLYNDERPHSSLEDKTAKEFYCIQHALLKLHRVL